MSYVDAYGTSRFLFGHFKNTSLNLEEDTMCSPTFGKDYSRPLDCNLTAYNFNLEWYCQHPSQAGLHCSDWTYSYTKKEYVIPSKTQRQIR